MAISKLQVVKDILALIGEDPETDAILARASIHILASMEKGKPIPDPVKKMKSEPVKTPVKKPAKKTERNPFDTGKLKALRAAGWSVAKIADEMRVSEQTIRNHMKKEGIA